MPRLMHAGSADIRIGREMRVTMAEMLRDLAQGTDSIEAK